MPTDFEVALQAANLRALTTVAMPDALIVATALLAGCKAIVTNHGQWKTAMSRLFANFLWLYLSDFL
ncbi:MAG: hypothetical protein Q7O66_23380 [Dehalococcoidia bacterium]|nr:hypothetical protein [Dehalococcoidia bacterium]